MTRILLDGIEQIVNSIVYLAKDDYNELQVFAYVDGKPILIEKCGDEWGTLLPDDDYPSCDYYFPENKGSFCICSYKGKWYQVIKDDFGKHEYQDDFDNFVFNHLENKTLPLDHNGVKVL